MARINTVVDYQRDAHPDILAHYNRAEIQRILPEIQRQQETKRDFIYPSPKLAVTDMGKLVLSEIQTFKVGEKTYTEWAEAEANAKGEKIIPQKSGGEFSMNRNAHRQLCAKLGVPVDYIDKIRNDGHLDLAAHNLSYRLASAKRAGDKVLPFDRMLVRTLDGNVRAVLSDQYLILDNIDLFFAAAQELEKVGAEIWQMRLSDNAFQIVAFSKNVSGVVTTDAGMEGFTGGKTARIPGHDMGGNDGGELQYAACRISNSETGCGGLNVDSGALTWACRNLSCRARTLRRVHVGRVAENDGVFSDETKQAEARMTWLKVRDMIRATFDAEKFGEWINAMNKAASTPIMGEIEKVVPNALTKYEIDDTSRAAIMRKLFESRDYSQYGLSQAITYTAHLEDLAGNGESASELENVGGEVMRATRREFEAALVAVD